MSIRNGGFLSLVFPAPDERRETSDYRAVPETDKCARYCDQGAMGTWSQPDPFPSPAEVKFYDGFGVPESDVRRGFCEVVVREDPAYDLSSYKDRFTEPKLPNAKEGETDLMSRNMEFRGANQRSRGFLTRPRVPTERG